MSPRFAKFSGKFPGKFFRRFLAAFISSIIVLVLGGFFMLQPVGLMPGNVVTAQGR